MNRRLLATVASVLMLAAVAAALLVRVLRRRDGYDNLIVGLTKVGRGVFAQRPFAKGEVVETCPLIVKPTDDWGPALRDYVFQHDDDNSALALGLCSLYNHAAKPNLVYEYDDLANAMVARAKRAIAPGEELRISYGSEWFSSRGIKAT